MNSTKKTVPPLSASMVSVSAGRSDDHSDRVDLQGHDVIVVTGTLPLTLLAVVTDTVITIVDKAVSPLFAADSFEGVIAQGHEATSDGIAKAVADISGHVLADESNDVAIMSHGKWLDIHITVEEALAPAVTGQQASIEIVSIITIAISDVLPTVLVHHSAGDTRGRDENMTTLPNYLDVDAHEDFAPIAMPLIIGNQHRKTALQINTDLGDPRHEGIEGTAGAVQDGDISSLGMSAVAVGAGVGRAVDVGDHCTITNTTEHIHITEVSVSEHHSMGNFNGRVLDHSVPTHFTLGIEHIHIIIPNVLRDPKPRVVDKAGDRDNTHGRLVVEDNSQVRLGMTAHLNGDQSTTGRTILLIVGSHIAMSNTSMTIHLREEVIVNVDHSSALTMGDPNGRGDHSDTMQAVDYNRHHEGMTLLDGGSKPSADYERVANRGVDQDASDINRGIVIQDGVNTIAFVGDHCTHSNDTIGQPVPTVSQLYI